MYRTGDLGRYLADGNIECLGRHDFQVKIRGHRIELGEIATRLSEHESVRDAIVVAMDADDGGKRLVAYFRRKGAGAIVGNALRSHMERLLPAYMVPVAFVEVAEWPLSPNRKLDRRLLPIPQGEAYSTRQYEAPLGETEKMLAGIWSELLSVPRVGRFDNFFELGGHSLLVVRAIERMRRHGLRVDVRTLFETTTLAELASVTKTIREIEL